jgi:hypothetical protein
LIVAERSMRIIAVLSLAFAAVALAPSVQAQSAPGPASGGSEQQSRAAGDARSEQEKKEARKARREHRKAVNHRLRRKH